MSYAPKQRDTKEAFYKLAEVEGPREAQKSFPNVAERTLRNWSRDFRERKELPPPGKQRLPGGGKSPAFGLAEQEELVRNCCATNNSSEAFRYHFPRPKLRPFPSLTLTPTQILNWLKLAACPT